MSSGIRHKQKCSRATLRLAPRAAQGGFAFMLVLVVLVVGSLTFYTQSLNQNSSRARNNDATRAALANAKEILIAWSAESEIDNNGPGHFPCPDNDNNGHGDGSACGTTATRIGRFPWKTLNAPDLRDSSGERLWYAVSPNFLNKASNLVNSDSQGIFRVTGTTDADQVIAIIFAPGPALAGQERGTESAKKNRVNYLEDTNFDDDLIVLKAGDESFNDHIALITAGDLFPEVEKKVSEKMQRTVVPMLHDYLEAWAQTGATRSFPYAASFNPGAATDSACGETGQSQGSMPLGSCGNWQNIDWSAQSGTCSTVHDVPDSMIALRCTVVISTGGNNDDDDDEESPAFVTKSVKFRAVLTGAGFKTLAMPIDKSRVLHTGATQPNTPFIVTSKRLNTGDIEVSYSGSYKVARFANSAARTTVITFPIYRIDKQYVYKLQGKTKDERDRLDPTWFFRNDWHRLTYYAVTEKKLSGAVGSPCTSGVDCLTVEHGAETKNDYETLLVLAGRRGQYLDDTGKKKLQTRPSDQIANYFEQKNADTMLRVFQSAHVSHPINDLIVSVCPWKPNPYQEVFQACP